MHIRKMLDTEIQFVDELLLAVNKHSPYPNLRKSGKILSELSLVAEALENEKFLAYIGHCEVEIDGEKQLFLAGFLSNRDSESVGFLEKLFTQSREIAKSLGYAYIFAFDNSGFLERKFGFQLTNFSGFFFEGASKTPQILKVFKLDENAEDEAKAIHFPEEFDVKYEEPLFSFYTSMSEQEYKNAVYKTRERARFKDSFIFAATIILALIYSVWKKEGIGFGIAIVSAFILARNIINPINFTKKYFQNLKEKHGTCDSQNCVFFLNDFLVFYDMISKTTLGYSYDDFDYLYLKKDYLFISKHGNDGDYMTYKDMADKNFMINFLISKCKNIKILK